MKVRKIISLVVAICGFGYVSAQVHEVSFVATDHRIDFHYEYSSQNEDYLFSEYELNPKLLTALGAIGEVYVNFVSSDTARYMKEIRPLIVKDSSADYLSAIPGVVKEHRYLGAREHCYYYFTISVDAFVAYCREKGINCDLASQTFGTEMKHYKFQQQATSNVYKNLYEDLASWCTNTESTGEHLYDYSLKVGDAHPYDKEGYSVIPATVVLKQNKNTNWFFKMFVDIMKSMSIPDSVAQVMKNKNYKTYHIKLYTLRSYEWQSKYRKDILEESSYGTPNLKPYYYAHNEQKKVDGQYYLPLNAIVLNSIFERIHYQFHIYDNISGKESSSYVVTDAMHLVPSKVYEQYSSQYDDDYETYCYMSDLGYTSCVYDLSPQDDPTGNIVMLAMTDTGTNVTESVPFDIIVPDEVLMKLTSLDITNSPDMAFGRIPEGNPEFDGPDPSDGWAYNTGYGNDYRSGLNAWNVWNTKYMLGFKYNDARKPIMYMHQDYLKMSATYTYDEPGIDRETIVIQNGEWTAEGGDEVWDYKYKGTITKDGRLIISEGTRTTYDEVGDEVVTKVTPVTPGKEHARFSGYTIVADGYLILRKK